MKPPKLRNQIPSWHSFECIIHDALRLFIPSEGNGGFIANVRLGHDRSHEADLLYPGISDGKKTCVIVECKNRPIIVDDGNIRLESAEEGTESNLLKSISGKIRDAKSNLQFESVRILVVGCTKVEFVHEISSELIAVGQPILAWINDFTRAQTFRSLEDGWNRISRNVVPIDQNSESFGAIADLPRFRPWDDPIALAERISLRNQYLQECEHEYYLKNQEFDRNASLKYFDDENEHDSGTIF